MLNPNAIAPLTDILAEAHDIMALEYIKHKKERVDFQIMKFNQIRDEILCPFIVDRIKKLSCVSIKSTRYKNDKGEAISGNNALLLLKNTIIVSFSNFRVDDPGQTVLQFLTQLAIDFDVWI